MPAVCSSCSSKAGGVLLDVVPLQLLYWLLHSHLWGCGLWAGAGLTPLAGPSNLYPLLCGQPMYWWSANQPDMPPGPTWRHEHIHTKHESYKSTLHISQPPGLMPAEIQNCLYCMYGHLGYCFHNYFWQRAAEGEGAVFERRNNPSLEEVSFGYEDLFL